MTGPGVVPSECPTCGRCSQDWSAPASRQLTDEGTKARQYANTEDRTAQYRDWRRKLGRDLYVSDIDQLEWRMVNNTVTPVGVLELTRVNGSKEVPQTYLDAILKRICDRDPQGRVACTVALNLGVKAFVVLFRWDLSEFWAYNLTDARGWFHMWPETYSKWINQLGKPDTRLAQAA